MKTFNPAGPPTWEEFITRPENRRKTLMEARRDYDDEIGQWWTFNDSYWRNFGGRGNNRPSGGARPEPSRNNYYVEAGYWDEGYTLDT